MKEMINVALPKGRLGDKVYDMFEKAGYPCFMGSPVNMAQVNQEEVSPELDAVLSVDTTKGNRIINKRGFAISGSSRRT